MTVFQTSQMTPGRFIGLIQTDGHFGWFFDSDKTLRPRVYLTTGSSNSYLLLNIVKPWLEQQGITSQYQEKTDKFGTSCNLYVERQKQVEKVIQIIDQASKDYSTLLVDNKLADYLALKYALKRTRDKQKVTTTLQREVIFCELADLKMILLENNNKVRNVDLVEERQKTESKLGIKNSTGAAKQLYQKLLEEANQKSESLVNTLVNKGENCQNCSDTLGQFIAGIMDGDGSFQVGVSLAPLNKPSYEFEPMFTLTDGYVRTRKHNIFELINQFFGNVTKPQPVGGKNADRLYIKSREVLKNLAAFTTKAQLVLKKNVERFKVMEKVVSNYDKVYTDQVFALSIIDDIEKYFNVAQRNYSPDECRRIINSNFSRS